MEHIDVVIVGAGLFGLTFAKTYLEVHPEADLVILDASSSIGGTWASERLYPGLKTNNHHGTYEHPDFPMSTARFGVKAGEHVPGSAVHEYLAAFAEHFDITRHIRFNTNVEVVEQTKDDQWLLTLTTDAEKSRTAKIVASKLVLAAGISGVPNMPSLAGADDFGAPIYHALDFQQHTDLLSTAKRVAVYGAGKSAWDAIYAWGAAGVQVDWIIRESGKGPSWMSPIKVTPAKLWMEKLLHTRALTWLSPSIWAPTTFALPRAFFARTRVGRGIVNGFFALLNAETLAVSRYAEYPETAKLIPWAPAMWSGTSLAILNYPTDVFDLVRDGTVRVHIGDIERLGPDRTIHLSSGEVLSEIEALHCSTGWKPEPPLKLSPPSLAEQLGLPHPPTSPEPLPITLAADAALLKRFPILCSAPNAHPRRRNSPIPASSAVPASPRRLTPYRLYRHMIPPQQHASSTARNFAVAGALQTLGHATTAAVQALWITAYLDHAPLAQAQTRGEMEWEAEMAVRFPALRYPTGSVGPAGVGDFVWEGLGYVDTLLADLGLRWRRKGWWWREWFVGYGPQDYKGLVAEWMEERRRMGSRGS